MTIKVFLHTRRPQNKEIVNETAEFASIPAVGEYISIPSSDEYYYKVLLVVHYPVTDEERQPPAEYDAEVYALGIKSSEAHKESKFFPKQSIQPDFN